MTIAFPGESADYRAARDRLLEQEIELRRATEAVAASRRALPPGGPLPDDYVFEGAGSDGAPTNVKLSELFEPNNDSLVIYNFMFPRDPGDASPGPTIGQSALLPLEEGPCPSCTALLDQLDGAAEHTRQHLNFVVIAKTSLPRLRAFAQERGWRRLRLLSSAANTYNRDYHGETAEGFQRPMLNVFHRDPDAIRHFWGSELFYAPTDGDQDPRHAGTIEPLWNLFDLTPEGRPSDWHEQLSYQLTGTQEPPRTFCAIHTGLLVCNGEPSWSASRAGRPPPEPCRFARLARCRRVSKSASDLSGDQSRCLMCGGPNCARSA